jgi:hypothetical protein
VKSSSSMDGDAVDCGRAAKPQLHPFARLASRQPSTTDRQPRAPNLTTTGAGSLRPDVLDLGTRNGVPVEEKPCELTRS